MTELAVVVVNHNAGSFLPACISSIYAAAGDLALDVVLVDNASIDGSVERVAREHPSLRVITNGANRGFAAAANQGIRATKAPYVFLLNPDAEIVGGSLPSLVKVAADRPRAGVLGPLVRNPDGSIQASARKVPGLLESLGHAFLGPFAPNNRFSRAYTMAEWDRSSEREVEWVSGSAMLIRREAFEAATGFDEGYFMYVEDVDLCTRLRLAGWSVLFSPELEVVHETGVSARKRSRRLAFEHSRSIYRYFAKHRAQGPAIFLKPLVRLAVWLRALLVTRGSRAKASARGATLRAEGREAHGIKAVVLVGGEGTRLRPLTEAVPKPLIPFLNRPFLHHVLDHLAAHGVREAILSSPYLEERFRGFLDSRTGDPAVTWITEAHPLGTSGAVAGALDHLDDTFLVLNGDILTDLDLTALIDFHRRSDALATIALTRVADARPFGLVETDPGGRVLAFKEKPVELVPGTVNAGTYVLEPRALADVPRGVMVSIERETFPSLIERGERLFAFVTEGYWRDLGTPEAYLQAHFDALEGRIGDQYPRPLIGKGCRIAPDAVVGKMVVLGDGSVVAPEAIVERSVLHEGVSIGRGAIVERTVFGSGVQVGAGAELRNSLVAAGARVAPGSRLEGARIRPGEHTG